MITGIDIQKELLKAYDKGAQSRQAEIDELKSIIIKYEAGLRKNKANKHKLLSKNIELQKRIDEALEAIEKRNFLDWLVYAEKVLKGETNE